MFFLCVFNAYRVHLVKWQIEVIVKNAQSAKYDKYCVMVLDSTYVREWLDVVHGSLKTFSKRKILMWGFLKLLLNDGKIYETKIYRFDKMYTL